MILPLAVAVQRQKGSCILGSSALGCDNPELDDKPQTTDQIPSKFSHRGHSKPKRRVSLYVNSEELEYPLGEMLRWLLCISRKSVNLISNKAPIVARV